MEVLDFYRLFPGMAVKEVVDKILTSRRITRSDQQEFMQALLSKNSLSMEEQVQVNRVFELLQKGLLRVVD